MPPPSKNTRQNDSLDESRKRGRSATRGLPETPSKKSRAEKIHTPNKSESEIPDMSTFLPQSVLGRLQTAQDSEEYKGFLRYLVALLFFKLRGIPENYFQPIVAASVPTGIKHFSSDFIEELRSLNDDLTRTLLTKLRGYADALVAKFGDEKVQNARDVAQAHRERKTQIPRPFPNKASVIEYMVLSVKDLIEIWTPILTFIDSDYIDNPERFQVNWLHNLEESSYVIISRIASGIIVTKRAYNIKSMIVDLAATSCHRTPISWPEHQLPFLYTNINAHWGLLSETWPRKHDSAVNKNPANLRQMELSSSSEDGLECDDDALSDEAMENVWAVNETDDFEQKSLVSEIFDIPGAIPTYQFDSSYCTAESSLIAQLNTSGLTMYTVERIEARMQTLKHFLVVAQTRLEEAQHALKVVKAKEERNRMIEAKYNEIMGMVVDVEAEVSVRQAAVDKNSKLYQSAKQTVSGASRRGATLSSILGQRNSPGDKFGDKLSTNRIRSGSNVASRDEAKRSEVRRPTSSHTPRLNTPSFSSGYTKQVSSTGVVDFTSPASEMHAQEPFIDNSPPVKASSHSPHAPVIDEKNLTFSRESGESEDEKDPEYPLRNMDIRDA